MVTGVFGAASQFFIPRILSFHIISQIGYMIVGLGLFTRGRWRPRCSTSSTTFW
jgi:multicomponent Na+:H+ antiporter subunit D